MRWRLTRGPRLFSEIFTPVSASQWSYVLRMLLLSPRMILSRKASEGKKLVMRKVSLAKMKQSRSVGSCSSVSRMPSAVFSES